MARTDQRYDVLGVGYGSVRLPDPRIEAQILDAVDASGPVLNVGAGTGNYEPRHNRVVAVEPSPTMLAQRTSPHPVVRATAEALPFADDTFDIAMAIFTIHHWTDRDAGLQEMARVARRQVSLVYDTDVSSQMWLYDYYEELAGATWELNPPTVASIAQHLDIEEVRILWIPADCSDGFTGAYWNRPERYLDPAVQAGMSTLARLDPASRATGTERLRQAIDSGDWDRRHGHLRTRRRFDMGYRITRSHRRPPQPHQPPTDTTHTAQRTSPDLPQGGERPARFGQPATQSGGSEASSA